MLGSGLRAAIRDRPTSAAGANVWQTAQVGGVERRALDRLRAKHEI
jgi:hypothetical protein